MRARIDIWAVGFLRDRWGQPISPRQKRIATTWAEIAGDVITMRAGVEIKQGMLIVLRGSEREIVGVEPDGRFLKLTTLLREGKARRLQG